MGLLAVSGIARAQTPLDILTAFGPGGPQNPQGALIQGSDGNFYGTTFQGGAFNNGTVFQLTPAGTLTVLHDFAGGTDGAAPLAGVIQAADGNFYGTTSQGGASNAGTVFQLTPTGALAVLHEFTGTDGANPWTLRGEQDQQKPVGHKMEACFGFPVQRREQFRQLRVR
jgi:uncharacterized repeat protein (TIGR03803 family)